MLRDITADDKIGLSRLQVLITCSMGPKTGGREDLGMKLVLVSPNKMYWWWSSDFGHDLASWIHFSKKREGSSELFTQTMSRTVFSGVQSHCSILSHGTLHHCLSSNNSLENSDREHKHQSRHLSCCKNVLLWKQAHFVTGVSKVHYSKSG